MVEKLSEYLRGWLQYFRRAQSKQWRKETEQWMRHRLRALRLKQTKRGPTTFKLMKKLGLNNLQAAKVASHRGSWWAKSVYYINLAMTNSYFDQLGLPRLLRIK